MSVSVPNTGRRRWGTLGLLILAFWAACALALAWYLAVSWNPALVARYAPLYLDGLRTTLTLVGVSYLAGALLSIPLAITRQSKSRILRGFGFAYVSFFRGTPLIAQIFLVYYGFGSFRAQFEAVGLWWFFRDAWYCGVFALALNTAAYQTEILRGAIASVPKGQWEGAASLALPRFVVLTRIVAPQALVVALRPYANELVLMIKASAIVAIITVFDLFGQTRRAFSQTFDFQTYLWAAVIYLVIVELIRIGTGAVEGRITRHLRR